jgi:hypothetical protein
MMPRGNLEDVDVEKINPPSEKIRRESGEGEKWSCSW